MVKFESEKWLGEFVETRSEGAFRKVVAEHSGLVLGTAMRRLNGDRGAAEDVMQEVFVLLAKKAGVLLKGEVTLSGWLYRQTCRRAGNRVRGEVRRREREEKFGAMKESGDMNKNEVMEEIDEALGELTERERELVICRYVEERDYAEMGKRFEISGEAARKKVGRAVEKLRVVLERRGVGVSASALAVMLVGLSGSKVSAALIAKVSGVSVKKGVTTGAGMFSLGGILAGAMGVSVVMGGVRIMEAGEVEVKPVVKSGRVVQNDGSVLTRVRNAGTAGRSLSDEEIWGVLTALDSEPQTMVTGLLLEDILALVPAWRVFEFFDEADERISEKMKERVFFTLVKQAVKVVPREVLKGLLERGLFKMRHSGADHSRRLGVMAFMTWSEPSFDDASAWLMDHWDEIDGLGHKGSFYMMEVSKRRKGGPFQPENVDTVADHLGQLLGFKIYTDQGFEGIEEFVGNFDDQSKVAVWKYVFLFNKVKKSELYPKEKAEYLKKFPDHEPYGELKEVSWLRWYKTGREKLPNGARLTKEEYMEALPPDLAADFKKSCLDEIPQDGEGGAE